MKKHLTLSILTCLATIDYSYGDGTLYILDNDTVSGLSADGQVAAGTNSAGYFYWTAESGVVQIGGTSPGNGAGGQAKVSDDGSSVSGTALNQLSGLNEISIYDISSASWTYLGSIGGSSGSETSSGWNIAGNGLSAVGLGWISAGTAHAVQWTASTGLVDLGSTVLNRSSRANTVNVDGTVVGGWQDASSGFRQGAVWNDGVQTLVWLNNAQSQRAGEVGDLSSDGYWAVGSGVSTNGFQAWRWNMDSGCESLGAWSNSTWRGASVAITADGSTIVGFYRPWPGPATFGQGFIWREETGLVSINDYAAEQGVDTGGFTFALPLDISADGQAIAGLGKLGAQTKGFILQFASEQPVCPEDVDADGSVSFTDLLQILSDWGACSGCPSDVDGDGSVGFGDIIAVLSAWGTCV